jgi:spermidine synthase
VDIQINKHRGSAKFLEAGCVTGYCISGITALLFQIIAFKLLAAAGMSSAISVAISLTVFVALSGVGAFISKFVSLSRIPLIEGAIGIYAISFFSFIKSQGVLTFVQKLQEIPLIPKELSLFLLILPFSMFMGVVIPIYHRKYESIKKTRSGFNSVYWGFHASGAIALITFEFSIFPLIGWVSSGILISSALLLNCVLSNTIWKDNTICKDKEFSGRNDFGMSALFILSIITGYAGVLSYKYFFSLTGAQIGDYSIVTAATFLGLGLSALVAPKLSKVRDLYLVLPAAGVMILPVAFVIAVNVTYLLKSYTGLEYHYLVTVIAAISITAPFILIGLSIPLAVNHGAKPHLVLFVVSIANTIGYWIYIIFSEYMNEYYVLLFAILIMALVIKSQKLVMAWVTCLGLVLALTPLDLSFNQYLLVSRLDGVLERMAEDREIFSNETYSKRFDVLYGKIKYGTEANEIRTTLETNSTKVSTYSFFVNSVQTVTPYNSSRLIQTESFVALVPALYVDKHDRSLVLGGGTGVSAGYAATIFKDSTIVDISPNTVSNLTQYKDLNLDVISKSNIINNDALDVLLSLKGKQSSEKYDFILGTLTATGVEQSAMFYTKEYFSVIKEAIAYGGVFAFWLDENTGGGDTEIINALRCEFKHVKKIAIRSQMDNIKAYYLLIASSRRLEIKENDKVDEILRLINKNDAKAVPNLDEVEGSQKSIFSKNHLQVNIKNSCAQPMASIEKLNFAYDYRGGLEGAIRSFRKWY